VDEGGSLHGHRPAVGVGIRGHGGGTHDGECAAGGGGSAGVRLLPVDEDALADLLDTPVDGGHDSDGSDADSTTAVEDDDEDGEDTLFEIPIDVPNAAESGRPNGRQSRGSPRALGGGASNSAGAESGKDARQPGSGWRGPPVSTVVLEYLLAIKTAIVRDPAYFKKIANLMIVPPDPITSSNPWSPDIYYLPRVLLYAPYDMKGSRELRCPICNSDKVGLDGYTDFRRVVGLENSLFTIARRYRCRQRHKGNCFAAWDPRLVAAAPYHVQEAFPVIFTHRLGVTRQLFDLMRTMYDSGRGIGPFADMVRENHTRAHHRKMLSFLSRLSEHISPTTTDGQAQLRSRVDSSKKDLPLFSSFKDTAGYNGCYGSRNFFRKVYTAHMQQLEALMKKRSAMVSARMLSGDHFFKILKCNFTFNGKRLFLAAYSLVNEHTEVMAVLLTLTKSLEELRDMLEGVQRRMVALGHPPLRVDLFFTDNPVAEASFLEGIFPGLDKGDEQRLPVGQDAPEGRGGGDVHADPPAVGAAPPDAAFTGGASVATSPTRAGGGQPTTRGGRGRRLRMLEFPPGHQLSYTKMMAETHSALDRFCRDLGLENGPVVIGMDAEWTVTAGPKGRTSSKLQLLQLSSRSETLVIHLSRLRSVPHQLRSLLANPSVFKVGKNVGGDAAKLLRDYGVKTERYLELGRLASKRQLVPSGSISLVALTRALLRRDLNKEESLRMSSWEHELSPEKVQYAALDAYAGLALYEKIQEMGSPIPLPASLVSGTSVLLSDPSGTQRVARCTVVANQKEKVGNLIIAAKSRIMVQVDEVLLPAFRLPFPIGRAPKTLREFVADAVGRGVAPIIVVPCDNLRDPTHPVEVQRLSETAEAAEVRDGLDPGGQTFDALQGFAAAARPVCDTGVLHRGGAAVGAAATRAAAGGPTLPEVEPEGTGFGIDDDDDMDWSDTEAGDADAMRRGLASGVRGDIMHAMDRLLKKLSKNHGIIALFSRCFASALMLYNKADAEAAKAVAAEVYKDMTWDQVMFRQPEWVNRRVRRFVPAPAVLEERLKGVFNQFGPVVDASTGQPLFNAAAKEAAKNVLELAAGGWLSDPPGVGMYVLRRRDRNGLPLWLCCRGTNSNEGSVHQKLVKTFLSMKGASAEIIHYVLLEWFHRTNIRAAHYNRGWPFYGHYDTRIVDAIVDLQQRVYGRRVSFMNHMCASDFDLPEFFCGVAPVSKADRDASGLPDGTMLETVMPALPLLSEQKRFLSEKMETGMPVLPVHTVAEKRMYFHVKADLRRTLGHDPTPTQMAVKFNHRVSEQFVKLIDDGERDKEGKLKKIKSPPMFYKMAAHMQMYQKLYDRSQNTTSTISLFSPNQRRQDVAGANVEYMPFGGDVGEPIHEYEHPHTGATPNGSPSSPPALTRQPATALHEPPAEPRGGAAPLPPLGSLPPLAPPPSGAGAVGVGAFPQPSLPRALLPRSMTSSSPATLTAPLALPLDWSRSIADHLLPSLLERIQQPPAAGAAMATPDAALGAAPTLLPRVPAAVSSPPSGQVGQTASAPKKLRSPRHCALCERLSCPGKSRRATEGRLHAPDEGPGGGQSRVIKERCRGCVQHGGKAHCSSSESEQRVGVYAAAIQFFRAARS